MGEVKFRAWLKEENRMAEVSDISFIGEEIDVYGEDGCLADWWGFNYIELMQYTGLKDKDGVEIYEGDIVQCLELRGDILRGYKSEVFFEYGCWLVHESETCDVELFLYDNTNPTKMPLTEIEVIGNIYENPELIS